jgi:hypothetical protein
LRSFSSSTTKPCGCCLQNSTTSGVTRIPIGTFRPCGAGRPTCLSLMTSPHSAQTVSQSADVAKLVSLWSHILPVPQELVPQLSRSRTANTAFAVLSDFWHPNQMTTASACTGMSRGSRLARTPLCLFADNLSFANRTSCSCEVSGVQFFQTDCVDFVFANCTHEADIA